METLFYWNDMLICPIEFTHSHYTLIKFIFLKNAEITDGIWGMVGVISCFSKRHENRGLNPIKFIGLFLSIFSLQLHLLRNHHQSNHDSPCTYHLHLQINQAVQVFLRRHLDPSLIAELLFVG